MSDVLLHINENFDVKSKGGKIASSTYRTELCARSNRSLLFDTNLNEHYNRHFIRFATYNDALTFSENQRTQTQNIDRAYPSYLDFYGRLELRVEG